MKKVLAFALVLVLVVALAAPACAISEKNDVYTLTFYHIFADEASGGHESTASRPASWALRKS